MENITEPTQTISPKVISVWRFQYMKSHISILLILCTLLFVAHYFHWYTWIILALYVVTAAIFIKMIYKLTIYPQLLQKSWRYQIDKDYIQISYGVFHLRRTMVPMQKIQKVHINEPSLLKRIGLANIDLQTSTTVIQIPAITLNEAEYIQKAINELSTIHVMDNKNIEEKSSTTPIDIYDESWRNMQLLSVTSCYIFLLLFLLLMLYVKLNDVFSFERNTIAVFNKISTSSSAIILGIAAFVLLSFILSSIYNYFKFGTYKVAVDNTYLYISQSGFKPVNAMIPKKYINGFIIDTPWRQIPFDFVKVKLIFADEAKQKSSITTNLLFPFISNQQVITVIRKALSQPQLIEDKSWSTFSNEAYFAELIQPSYILVIITFLFMFFWPEYWFLPVLYALFIIVKRVLKVKQQRYFFTQQSLNVKTGGFSTVSPTLTPSTIERIDYDQTWIQCKLGLVSIIITTNTHPNYVIKLEHVQKESADEICAWYKNTLFT